VPGSAEKVAKFFFGRGEPQKPQVRLAVQRSEAFEPNCAFATPLVAM
jgi:hypothetical protein